KNPSGVLAKIESDSLNWTGLEGQRKGDTILLRKGYNINMVDMTNLAETKIGTADVYSTDSPGVKLRRGGQTLPVPKIAAPLPEVSPAAIESSPKGLLKGSKGSATGFALAIVAALLLSSSSASAAPVYKLEDTQFDIAATVALRTQAKTP